ncbi:hypothetical protein EAH_00050150 [Eimeria acervulina]|uniref:Uncharacterized protein n=1 Tax=Eimeria acervulina TaxID=5801 RepID=U6GL06_EIMAC|nr:hypothetical protein EAH_00050150 [Eimeria acervulina]CDI80257.1 hypothetical protein EAH_00050150 [Eimeria acervulina]
MLGIEPATFGLSIEDNKENCFSLHRIFFDLRSSNLLLIHLNRDPNNAFDSSSSSSSSSSSNEQQQWAEQQQQQLQQQQQNHVLQQYQQRTEHEDQTVVAAVFINEEGKGALLGYRWILHD